MAVYYFRLGCLKPRGSFHKHPTVVKVALLWLESPAYHACKCSPSQLVSILPRVVKIWAIPLISTKVYHETLLCSSLAAEGSKKDRQRPAELMRALLHEGSDSAVTWQVACFCVWKRFASMVAHLHEHQMPFSERRDFWNPVQCLNLHATTLSMYLCKHALVYSSACGTSSSHDSTHASA